MQDALEMPKHFYFQACEMRVRSLHFRRNENSNQKYVRILHLRVLNFMMKTYIRALQIRMYANMTSLLLLGPRIQRKY